MYSIFFVFVFAFLALFFTSAQVAVVCATGIALLFHGHYSLATRKAQLLLGRPTHGVKSNFSDVKISQRIMCQMAGIDIFLTVATLHPILPHL